ncbi:MAG TPA: Sapep family Mn(2+)-dependent dipeptidase [Caproiciproducens sp.]|nr:Sapep family Mn(2+)-dependent dipeptidase [Caproiciproducens sp.]
MSFGSKILNYREDIIKDLAELVSIPSVLGEPQKGMPFGRESAEALNRVLGMAEKMGFATKNVGGYAGHAEFGTGNEVAAVVAHVDVVPAGEGWETDPFTLTKKGNLYYGRGAADDKGAAIVALYCLKALKDENVQSKRRLRVIFGAGEEIGSDDIEQYLASEQLPVMAFTPDSDYGICNREKGILRLKIGAKQNDSAIVREFKAGTVINAVPSKAVAELACTQDECARLEKAAQTAKGDFKMERLSDGVRITSIGTASHAAQPQEGFNAATYLVKLLASVFSYERLGSFLRFIGERIGTELDGESLGVRQSDKESGPLTLNLGLLSMSADEASMGVDIRYPVLSDGEDINSIISDCADEYGLTTEILGHTKPLFLPESSTFISLLKDSYQAITGEPAKLYSTGGGTYARSFQGNAVAFGPFFPDEPDRRLHNTNENIDIDRFMIHAQICLEAMYRMLTK